MTDVFSLKVEELVEKIKNAQITSVELCQLYIDRINKFEKDIKAWAHFDKKLLLEKAAEADEHRRLGKPLGPLHGIPVAVKDIVGTLDMPTECGTVIRKGKSYSQNAEIIELLISAGAIVMGYDTATVHYSSEGMLEETKKGPLFDPKFIFYKTDYWKLLGKKSREAFEYFIKSFKSNIEVFDTPSYFKDIHKYHQIIHETDLANNFSIYYKKHKKKLSKYMQDAISKGNKHTAKEYAEAIDFMRRSYESYKEVFEDYHGVLSPSSPGVALKGLKSTGTAEFNKVWSYLGTPCISLPILQGENNLPLGIQLIGAKYDDQRFLGVANWLEKECNN